MNLHNWICKYLFFCFWLPSLTVCLWEKYFNNFPCCVASVIWIYTKWFINSIAEQGVVCVQHGGCYKKVEQGTFGTCLLVHTDSVSIGIMFPGTYDSGVTRVHMFNCIQIYASPMGEWRFLLFLFLYSSWLSIARPFFLSSFFLSFSFCRII